MVDVFRKVVELSWQAGVLALVVMAARLALRRAPKWAVCLLWALVAVRLVLPFSLPSPVSLQAAQSPVSAALYELPQTRGETADPVPAASDAPAAALPSETVTAQPPEQGDRPVVTAALLAAVWLAGVAMMLTYLLASYLRIYHRVRTAVRLEGSVYRCDQWGTPFVLGMFRPRIYVPEGMDEADLPQVLAHERCHIRRGDHVVKPLAFLLLAVHWFNPVLWAAYILLGRDMENACDERVLRTLDSAGRAAYSRALVACAVQERPAAVCPLAFGEVAVKERVKNALRYRKPALWAAVLLLIAAVIIGACFLTSPDRREDIPNNQWDAETLYAMRTPYVGDNSAVSGLLSAIGLDKMGLGDWGFVLRLSTEQEPYGLTLCYTGQYETVVGTGDRWAQQMKAGGYLAMALVDNLEWVAWQVNAVEQGRITDDGTYDIAAARQSVDGLRQLIVQLETDLAGGTVGGGAGAAFREITPWPSEGENDPVSIDPADYGIVYDAEHLPDWETCPLSYLCAYYLGGDGAYAEAAADTLAQRYRQAPNTVQNYLNKLAARHEGADGQILSAIRTAAGETYSVEPTVDVQNGAGTALDDRLAETLTGYFLMRANAVADNDTGTAYCVAKLRSDAVRRAQAAVWPYVAAEELRAVHVTVNVTEMQTLHDGGTRLALEELTMLDYGAGSDQYGWGTTHRLEIHEDRVGVPRVTWDAYDESDLGDGHVSQDQQTDMLAAAMDMAITGPWTGLVTDTRTEQAGGTEYHLLCIAGRWFGGTVQEFGTAAQVGDLVSVWNYAAAGGDFEPLWQQELLETA